MAIVKLSKLKLYGMVEEKTEVVDLLYKSNLVHIKDVNNIPGMTKNSNESKIAEYEQKLQKLQKVIEFYENLRKNSKYSEILVKENDFNDFENQHKEIIDELSQVVSILEVIDEKNHLIAEIKNEKSNNESQNEEFDNTDKKLFLINIKISSTQIEELKSYLDDLDLTHYTEENGNFEIVIPETELNRLEEIISKLKLKIDFKEEKIVSAETFEYYSKLLGSYEVRSIKEFIDSGKKHLDLYKIYYDYLFEAKQKLELDNSLGFTKKTFMLNGYIENDKKQEFENLIKSSNLSVSYEFSKPSSKDAVPTKTKNRKLVKPFEFVTNMYSVPRYNEIDPNYFVGIFFSLYFGFIMADIGYGIILTLIGLCLSLKKGKNTGMKELMRVIAIGGACSIIFGIFFGSFFGYTNSDIKLIPKAILPDPSKNVMLYLIGSVAIGAVQIMVSFVLKGILLIRRGRIAEAICSAFAWDIFFIGVALFGLDLANITSGLQMIGIIIAASGVAISVIGNIIINKGFDRLAKSFGSLYGILNLFSDLLSYTRLFGLMLSGVIIASIVNQLASGFFTSIIKAPLGIIILLIGHSFNIAMGALGAYIHDARLQYIEFFSRFYEGEGELFMPFGSDYSYIKLVKVEE